MDFDFSARSGIAAHATPNITPLIDVVFILLIFFMLTSTFRTDRGIDVNLPASDTAQQQVEDEQRSLTISISEDGKVFIEKDQYTVDQLESRIRAFLQRFEKGGIIVKSDAKVEVQALVSVMDQLRKAEATNVTLATIGLN